MPFSGGGGGQLTNHVHDNTPLQGGPLSFAGVTIGGMNAGDITFSDGSALQTLAYPAVPNNETLTASTLSTAPSWAVASASAETFAKWEEFVLGAPASSITATFTTPYVLADFDHLLIEFEIGLPASTATDVNLTWNTGLGGNHYFNEGLNGSGGVASGVHVANGSSVTVGSDPGASTSSCKGTVKFYSMEAQPSKVLNFYEFVSTGDFYQTGACFFEGTYTEISAITITASAGNFLTNSKIRTYRIAKP